MQTDNAADTPAAYRNVTNAIEAAANSVGRNTAEITLVAVSKTKPAAEILPVLDAGHTDFGENRLQEAQDKWPPLQARFPATKLHLIGGIQSNKARDAVAVGDVIHSLDREKLARILAEEMARSGRRPDCFIQINTGEEKQKSGILPGAADEFIRSCRETYELPVIGLMCLPPAGEEPALHFALLSKIAKRHGLKNLSMGMTADYETAIAFGATHIRVGSAIFGARES